ncbi:hypothetical protein HOP62_12250 [Halomonas sp. MCCC 1A17488]|uniref:Uncharacterized protein n=1 Tax=Billgrantia sulfidoxydans TaxID=2733484 RepID=A0ABX7W1I8_9GAMM|nr:MULTISPECIES: hypothetical protein [Halomonas]MCE8016840.1 hypothetical protein [Halomonas sp. MCCC 1A17488]MCG3240173.1 hypothetical protein [Halomonas sp. MCCC 1A17488]QPP49949.1 hypothetical protein I4484_02120 [Halomonas sp. SS10-MC5]QTP53562.1 hypothetical protein HNO51_02035 [Halomonas sulfidoxydans]
MKPIRHGNVAWLMVVIVVGLLGCKESGPEDVTERNIDEAMDETQERLGEVGEKIEKDMEEERNDNG